MRYSVAFVLMYSLAAAQSGRVVRVLDIGTVWSAHPVGFELITRGDRQFAAYYDRNRDLTVAARSVTSGEWRVVRLPSKLGWDSHNYVTLAIDRDGYIHLAGNMHVAPLTYFRTSKPLDISSFERVPAMTGRDETRCTYPRFLHGPGGELIFMYRDGRSGSGNQIMDVYDEKSRAWRRLLDQPLTDGQGRSNAYFVGPQSGPDGYFHLVWTWRDTPDCSTNHDLSYARSKDLAHWETSAGMPLQLPIRRNTAEIIDPVPVHGGMINGNTRIGFDANGRVVVTYHKFDGEGNTQIMNARRKEDGWKIYQTTGWKYRWDFQGGGSIPFEIRHGAITAGPGGALLLDYQHVKYGGGTWKLDAETLTPLGSISRAPAYPEELNRVESAFPGMQAHVSAGGSSNRGTRFYLRWETLGPNRDRPRPGPLPPPSVLRVYEIAPESAVVGRGQ